MVRTVWYGMVWYGMVRYGTVRYGTVWYGMVRYGTVRYGTVWYGMVCYGMARRTRTDNRKLSMQGRKEENEYESRYSVFLINNPCFKRIARIRHDKYTQINQLCIKRVCICLSREL